MGKISKILYMIDLLNTGNIYSIKELSKKVGVTERMIRYYKEEIINNGIDIESFKGPNGGYFMISKNKNYTSINKYDVQLLEYSYETLKDVDFKYMKKYREFIEKIKNMNSICDEKSRYIFNIMIENPKAIEKVLIDAINKSEKIDIIYDDIDGKKSTRTIHPLHFFEYKGDSYVTAFCELRNDIRHFEVKRIDIVK